MVPEGAELGPFTGRGFGMVDRSDNVTFTWSLAIDNQYQIVLRTGPVVSWERTL